MDEMMKVSAHPACDRRMGCRTPCVEGDSTWLSVPSMDAITRSRLGVGATSTIGGGDDTEMSVSHPLAAGPLARSMGASARQGGAAGATSTINAGTSTVTRSGSRRVQRKDAWSRVATGPIRAVGTAPSTWFECGCMGRRTWCLFRSPHQGHQRPMGRGTAVSPRSRARRRATPARMGAVISRRSGPTTMAVPTNASAQRVVRTVCTLSTTALGIRRVIGGTTTGGDPHG